MGGPDSQRRKCLFGKERLRGGWLCFAVALKYKRMLCSLIKCWWIDDIFVMHVVEEFDIWIQLFLIKCIVCNDYLFLSLLLFLILHATIPFRLSYSKLILLILCYWYNKLHLFISHFSEKTLAIHASSFHFPLPSFTDTLLSICLSICCRLIISWNRVAREIVRPTVVDREMDRETHQYTFPKSSIYTTITFHPYNPHSQWESTTRRVSYSDWTRAFESGQWQAPGAI